MPPPDESDITRRVAALMPPKLSKVEPSSLSTERLLKIVTAVEGVALAWLRGPDLPATVRGFGFGVRWYGGQPSDEPVFEVFTGEPFDMERYGLPRLFPKEYLSLLTQKVVRSDKDPPVVDPPVTSSEVGEMSPFGPEVTPEQLRARQRPMFGGVSVGNARISGTLGMRVEQDVRSVSRKALFLTNCHVLASDVRAPVIGEPIVQPGGLQYNSGADAVVGTVFRAEKLMLELPNVMDAAVGEITDPAMLSHEIAELGALRYWRALRDVPIGTPVAKVGSMTGLRVGVVRSVGVTFRLEYRLRQPLIFKGQILTSHIAEGGDSGSVLVSLGDRPAVIGLVLGGSREASLASPIEEIQKKLRIRVAREQWPAPPPPRPPRGVLTG